MPALIASMVFSALSPCPFPLPLTPRIQSARSIPNGTQIVNLRLKKGALPDLSDSVTWMELLAQEQRWLDEKYGQAWSPASPI